MGIALYMRSFIPTTKADAFTLFASFLVVLAGLFAVWQAAEPMPIYGGRILSVMPENAVLDRGRAQAAVMLREICTTHPTDAIVQRQWIDETGAITPVVDDRYVFDYSGCKPVGPFRVYPPFSLGEGRHTYRVTIRWCNLMRCVSHRVPDVEFVIVGQHGAGTRLNRGSDSVPYDH